MADPRLLKDYDSNEMARMVACASVCVRHLARRRPRMSQVHIPQLFSTFKDQHLGEFDSYELHSIFDLFIKMGNKKLYIGSIQNLLGRINGVHGTHICEPSSYKFLPHLNYFSQLKTFESLWHLQSRYSLLWKESYLSVTWPRAFNLGTAQHTTLMGARTMMSHMTPHSTEKTLSNLGRWHLKAWNSPPASAVARLVSLAVARLARVVNVYETPNRHLTDVVCISFFFFNYHWLREWGTRKACVNSSNYQWKMWLIICKSLSEFSIWW